MAELFTAKLERYTKMATNPPSHTPDGKQAMDKKWTGYARDYERRNKQLDEQIALAERMLEKYKKAKKNNDMDMIRERAAYYQAHDLLEDNDIEMEE